MMCEIHNVVISLCVILDVSYYFVKCKLHVTSHLAFGPKTCRHPVGYRPNQVLAGGQNIPI
jgi:hypothetical protein